MSHLSPDQRADAVEHTLVGEAAAHLRGCAECREQVEQLASLSREIGALDITEPSPLFWDHFSAQVREAIALERQAPSGVARWLRWPVLAPLGAFALIVLALVSTVASTPPAAPLLHTVNGAVPLDAAVDAPADVEDHWDLMTALLSDVDFEVAADAGVRTLPGTADAAVWQLSSGEQEELLRLLRAELGESGG